VLRVTWEWLGMAPALDLANTVVVTQQREHDLIASAGDFAEWAQVEAGFLPAGSPGLLRRVRADLLELRRAIREILVALTAGARPARASLDALNAVSARSPEWLAVDVRSLELATRRGGRARDALLAHYARSAMQLVVGADDLRRCPAPSCGMFYVTTRAGQRWCSTQCGTRARVARHYRSTRRAAS
jgi:predicted RNA-binding Zn ribbon-like protein